MHIHLICVGRRMPDWVEEGYREYAKRLPPECALRLVEIEAPHRGRRAAAPGARPAGRPDPRSDRGSAGGSAGGSATASPRPSGGAGAAREEEAQRIARCIPKGAGVVALDGRGLGWSTEELARQLAGWMGEGRDRALLVGGPDGLADSLLARADQCWSLSRLTFPHPLVRVILAEQLYRAWTILKGHPYHRG